MKLTIEHLAAYLPYKIECSYKEYSSERKRLKAILTGVSLVDGIETTYKRKRNGTAGDLIGFEGHNNINVLEFKLYLHPLSYLTKEIEHNGEKFVPLDLLNSDNYPIDYFEDTEHYDYLINWIESKYKTHHIHFLPYGLIQQLLEWNFDIFDLINNNLAIDINTI